MEKSMIPEGRVRFGLSKAYRGWGIPGHLYNREGEILESGQELCFRLLEKMLKEYFKHAEKVMIPAIQSEEGGICYLFFQVGDGLAVLGPAASRKISPEDQKRYLFRRFHIRNNFQIPYVKIQRMASCLSSVSALLTGEYCEEEDILWLTDWVVDYAEPTSHVWDWDSAYVKEHGHPAVTPLDEAVESGNMEGWKVNEVTEFTSSEGENPNEDYSDNVIFPSGTADPLTISDWEWMLEAFQRAIEDKGFSGNADSYGISMYYPGYIATGDLASSFGAGTGMWSKDADQKVCFGGNGDGFRTYLECLNAWNNNGWLDSRFETRASDIFFQINQTGTAQGQVGMWYGLAGSLGTTIRTTCADPTDQQRAYVMGCAVPINDVYGTEEQKFITPDAFYQGSRIAGKIAITTAAEDKDLGALLTCLDWFYTPEGAATRSFGLSQEQLDSCEIKNNLYEENNIPGAYTLGTDANGNPLYTLNYEDGSDLCNALKPIRLVVGMEYSGAGADIDYTLDRGDATVTADAKTQWTKYISTASVSDYNAQFADEQNELYTSLSQTVNDYMAQNVPVMIKEGLDSWDAYVEGLNSIGIDEMTAVYQEIVDELFQK